MLALVDAPPQQRTVLARDDLDWLPPQLKAVRWATAGVIWTGMAGAVGAGILFGHGSGVYLFPGKLLGMMAAGGYYTGDKAARALLRRRLVRLAHGDVDLGRLKHEADGELVHVRGRIRARELLAGLIEPGQRGVYRRVRFTVDDVVMVHEAALDFSLTDEKGEHILVQAMGARLVAPEGRSQKLPGVGGVAQRLYDLPLPVGANRTMSTRRRRLAKGKSVGSVRASEVLLRDGDEVEVVGYKSRVVDPTVVERLERDTPTRATLRAGKELPLIIAPARPT